MYNFRKLGHCVPFNFVGIQVLRFFYQAILIFFAIIKCDIFKLIHNKMYSKVLFYSFYSYDIQKNYYITVIINGIVVFLSVYITSHYIVCIVLLFLSPTTKANFSYK